VVAALGNPVVVILVLAGIFDGLSGNPIHSILLLAVAVALAWDGLARHRTRLDPSPAVGWTEPAGLDRRGALTGIGPTLAGRKGSVLPAPVVAVGIIVYAVIAGGFSRYSWPMTVAAMIPGSIALVIAWGSLSPARPKPPKLEPGGALAWASVFVALGIWELTNLLLQPSLTTDSYAHPTLSVLTDPLLGSHPSRSIALALWLALGWFLVQR